MAEIERLREELQEFTELKEYAKSLGQETYLELHAKNERLRAAIKRVLNSNPYNHGQIEAAMDDLRNAIANEQLNITLTMLSEQYRLAAKEWCQLDAAANLLEESKSAVLSQMINRQLQNDPKMALNRAETNAKGSQEYKDYITNMVKAREKANLSKVDVKWIEMRHREEQSVEASARAESRL